MTTDHLTKGLAGIVAAAALLFVVTLGDEEPVCRSGKLAAPVAVLAFTSPSDIDTAREMAPSVARQAAQMTAEGCATAISAIATANVQSDLEPRVHWSEPAALTAPNRAPYLRRMRQAAERHFDRELVQALRRHGATPTSPYLTALVKLFTELRELGLRDVRVLVIGDGVAVEKSPSGRLIDFRSRRVDEAALDEYVPELAALNGTVSCVALLGAGARSQLDALVLRRAGGLLDQTLTRAGVMFAATRGDTIPARCAGG